MPVRSVIQVDVDNAQFQAYKRAFDAYKKELDKMPDSWKEVNEEAAKQPEIIERIIDGTGKQAEALKQQTDMIESIIDLIGKQAEKLEELGEEIEEQKDDVEEEATSWEKIERFTRSVSVNILTTTGSLLKWSSIAGIFSGLIGAGSLFGLDRLGSAVSSARRGSLGLGTSIGENRAFDLNFGRLVDTGSYLGAVNEAQHDVTKRSALYGAGLSEKDINGRDSAQVGTALLSKIKQIVDQTPEAQLAQVLQARGLSQFIGLQDAQRLRNTSSGEVADLLGSYNKDRTHLGLTPGNARVWQDFTTQMERAGSSIENTFVKGLTPLIPALSELSGGVTKAVEAFLSAPKLREWIQDLAGGLEKAAKYVSSDEFQNKIVAFVTALGTIADKVIEWGGWIGNGVGNVQRGAAASQYALAGMPIPPQYGGPGANNPGNLRPPGASSGFQSYATPEEGYKAMQRQLMLYYNRDNLKSVGQIVSKWAPPSENDTASYIGDVAKRVGVGSMSGIDLNDQDTMSKLVAAMSHHENSKNTITPAQVKIILYGSPGGNPVTNAQQATTPGGQ